MLNSKIDYFLNNFVSSNEECPLLACITYNIYAQLTQARIVQVYSILKSLNLFRSGEK